MELNNHARPTAPWRRSQHLDPFPFLCHPLLELLSDSKRRAEKRGAFHLSAKPGILPLCRIKLRAYDPRRPGFGGALDYIHFNPMKYGLVEHPAEWRRSSFGRCVAGGLYPAGGCVAPASNGQSRCRQNVSFQTIIIGHSPICRRQLAAEGAAPRVKPAG